MATLEQMETALVNAHRAGDTQAARVLAAAITAARGDKANLIPGAIVPGTGPAREEPGAVDTALGTGEAALTLATGATGGTMGLIGGALKGMAEQILRGDFGSDEAGKVVQQAAMKGAKAMTYAPRTESGREQAQVAGEFLANTIPPFVPLIGPVGAIAQSTRAAAPLISATAGRAVDAAKTGARAIAERVTPGGPPPTSGTMASVGAKGVDAATLRQAKANELPVPVKLTEGQKTRDFVAQRFERETAKDPALGEPIRERFAQQNQQLVQNMDAFIDLTGAEAPDLRSIGLRVDSAIRSRAARDKARIRTLYKEAEKAGETSAPVSMAPVLRVLDESASAESTAPVLVAARRELERLGKGKTLDMLSLGDVEQLRKFVNKVTGADPTNIKFARDVKEAIDASTAGAGGAKYQAARAARAKFARDYEDIALVRNIIGQKRGTADRAIALEDVLNRSIIDPSASLDSVRQVRRLLQTEGENGRQAWKEMQGGTLKYIRDEATKNVARNERGDPIVSAAQLDRVVTQLDKSGKLDFVFGKKGAEQLRTINDVAKDVLTAPPGAVNTSNTASVLLAAMDMAVSGMAGVPVPIMSGLRIAGKQVKDARVRARVKKVLGE